MTYLKNKWRAISLWLGMYAITFSLFWIETGHAVKSLVVALGSATIKTAWSLLHRRMFHKPEADAEEIVRI